MTQYFSVTDMPYGKSWGEWTVLWWKWISAIPKQHNPMMGGSSSSNSMSIANDDPNVYFACGGYGATDGGVHHVKNNFEFTVPGNKAIFLPTMNVIMSYAENPALKTDQDLIDWVRKDQDDIIIRQMYLNEEYNKRIDGERVASLPFDLILPENNIFDAPAGQTRAASDGYWVFIKPLDPEEETATATTRKMIISTFGACSLNRTSITAKFNINVIPSTT